jgi:sulfate adenylyltransferase
MNQAEYDSVVKEMRLPSGLLFGLPIVLDTNREDISLGDKVGGLVAGGRAWSSI